MADLNPPREQPHAPKCSPYLFLRLLLPELVAEGPRSPCEDLQAMPKGPSVPTKMNHVDLGSPGVLHAHAREGAQGFFEFTNPSTDGLVTTKIKSMFPEGVLWL